MKRTKLQNSAFTLAGLWKREWICIVILAATAAMAVSAETATTTWNLLRNASFERSSRDVLWSGYNRSNVLTDAAAIRAVTMPPLQESAESELLEKLDEELGAKAHDRVGWSRAVGKAFHGNTCLRTDLRERTAWGTELKGGKYTFSVYARSAEEEDMLKLVCETREGRSGKIRAKQEKSFRLNTEWQRCVFTANGTEGPVTWWVETLGDGTVWLDAVQLVPGTEPLPFQPHPWDQAPPKDIPRPPQTYRLQHVRSVPELKPLLHGLGEVSRTAPDMAATADGAITLRAAGLDELDASIQVPVNGGVPLPRGHVFDVAALQLLADGKSVPAQFGVLSRHVMDGSLQAVLVDTVASPGQSFTLAYTKGLPPKTAPPANALKTELSATEIRIDTGPLVLTIDRSSGRMLRQLRAGEIELLETEQPAGVWTADPVGDLFWGKADSVEIEEQGPLRCAIVFRGTHRNTAGLPLFRYAVRLHAYAGMPILRLEHTFFNDQGPYATTMTGVGVRLPFRDGLMTRFDTGDGRPADLANVDGASLVEPGGLRLWHGAETEARSASSSGWLTLSGEAVAVTAAVREWPWMTPKEFFFAHGSGLDICVWPRHMTRGLVVPRGVARSHRIWLHIDTNGAATARDSLLPYFFGHPRLEADAAHYCDSTVFGKLSTREPERFPRYEEAVGRYSGDGHGGFPPPGVDSWRGYFLTYGDDRGDMGWGNMETMVDHCMYLLYIRSLNPWYYHRATVGALHYRDVDICHPWGQTRCHSHNHTLYPWDNSHAWIKGVLDHYLLTGDRRSLDVANEHGRWLLSTPLDYEIERGTRRFTRTLQNLADIYRITGHRAYYDNFVARMDIADRLRQGHDNVSRFQLNLHYRKGKDEETKASYGNMGFVQAYGINAVMLMDQATGDPRWRETFLEEMRFVLASRGQEKPFTTIDELKQWGEGKGTNYSSGRDMVALEAVARLARLTGNPGHELAARYGALTLAANTNWRSAYGNIAYAGVAFSAFGLYDAQRQGLGPAAESQVLGVIRNLPNTLPDPGFEREEGAGWAGRKDRTMYLTTYQVSFSADPEIKRQGAAALCIQEAAYSVDKYKWRLLRETRGKPVELDNTMLINEPGTYEFTGYTRADGDARPDIVLHIDGRASGQRRTIAPDLPSRMPKAKYLRMMASANSGLGEKALTLSNGMDMASDVLQTLDETPNGPRPAMDKWWRWRIVFAATEISAVTVSIRYVFPPVPGGRVWYDDFQFKKLASPSSDTIGFAPVE